MDIITIILAAGSGRRMRTPGVQKVCLDIDGVPAILRGLQSYDSVGVKQHVVVVGEHGEQVLAVVGRQYPNAVFVHQGRPLGTGHATRCGAQVLQASGYEGSVLVVAGDKVVAPELLRELQRQFREESCDLAFVTAPKADNPGGGRVLKDGHGHPVAIVEMSEVHLAHLAEDLERLLAAASSHIAGHQLLGLIHRHFPDPAKARKAVGEVYDCASAGAAASCAVVRETLETVRQKATVSVWEAGQRVRMSAAEAEARSSDVNQSIYLFRARALYEALAHLDSENAQQEEFLTDAIKALASLRGTDGNPRYRLRSVPVSGPTDVLSFNTPEELKEVSRIVAERRDREGRVRVNGPQQPLRSVREWLSIFEEAPPALQAFLRDAYGDDGELRESKRREYQEVLALAARCLSPERGALLVRSPGRINLMGRHIDHRGGCVNVIALSEEVLMVAAPRPDDHVHLYNAQAAQFGRADFSIGREAKRLEQADWLACVNSSEALEAAAAGGWSNYVRAAALRLQHELPSTPLRGADLCTYGTIPIGSGLSSSSALVVAATEALCGANGLDIHPYALADLCGEGEWLVGTRGGSADHAAIKLSRRGQVAQVSFLPFEVRRYAPFFTDYRLVVCHSGEEARKSEGARETFNSRILGYVMAELAFKREFPQYADGIEHLRDIHCANLGVTLAELYEMLKAIPQAITEEEFQERYGPFTADESSKLATLRCTLPQRARIYRLRGLLLYCMAECSRAELCMSLLTCEDAESLGRLWTVSHEGDRVTLPQGNGQRMAFSADVSDARLETLVGELRSSDPETAHAAHLHRQPGVYACSTPRIDHIVDLALPMPGVTGAQMAGAGLGGCVMILVHSPHAGDLVRLLESQGFAAKEYHPVKGAEVLKV